MEFSSRFSPQSRGSADEAYVETGARVRGLSSGGIYKCVHMYIAERKAEAMNEFSSRTNCLLEFSVYRRPI